MEPPLDLPISIDVRRELLRKSLHLPGLAIPFLGHYLPWPTLIACLLLSFLYLLSEQLRLTQKQTLPLFGALTRKLTRNGGLDLAPVFLALGLGFASFFLPLRAALAGAILVCICDGLAAVVGMKWGEKRWPWGSKTYLGSSVFFLAAFLFLWPLLSWEGALATAAAGMALEAVSFRGIDNFLLPLIGGLVARVTLMG